VVKPNALLTSTLDGSETQHSCYRHWKAGCSPESRTGDENNFTIVGNQTPIIQPVLTELCRLINFNSLNVVVSICITYFNEQ
jgi:hypothetical protein